MEIDWQRWRYRRLAWKDDQGLWCDMHPRLARGIERAWDAAWPLRNWYQDAIEAIRNHNKRQAVLDTDLTVGYRHGEVKYWKYDGSAAEIYAQARERGWDGQPGQHKCVPACWGR